MFRLEKVFQNDDSGYYLFINFFKFLILTISIYIFSILEKNSIYDLLKFEIYTNSKYFLYSIFFSLLFFLFNLFGKKKEYKQNLFSFVKYDVINFIISNTILLSLFFVLNIKFDIDKSFFILCIYLIIVLGFLKIYFNFLYNQLISKNIIQKNIMLVGTYEEIKKILAEIFDKIYVFKCCLIIDYKDQNISIIKSELKFPIFNEEEDIRSILEYHSLGQIWVLNANKKKKHNIFDKITEFSVDTLNVNLDGSKNLKNKNLLAKKFEYEFFAYSKFYGVELFIKILLDKILSIFFLILASPIILLSSIFIYIEDGFPILFTQNRTGWDGRRFKVYKLRSLYNRKYNPVSQVTKDDNRKLKIGRFIRRYSIDELPQLYNVLRGEMSLVGPRPHPVMLDLDYYSIYSSFLTRYRCNPGLTGWAQINGLRGPTPNPDTMKKRMEYDLWYLNNWTIWLDFFIIIKTFYSLIKYKGE